MLRVSLQSLSMVLPYLFSVVFNYDVPCACSSVFTSIPGAPYFTLHIPNSIATIPKPNSWMYNFVSGINLRVRRLEVSVCTMFTLQTSFKLLLLKEGVGESKIL